MGAILHSMKESQNGDNKRGASRRINYVETSFKLCHYSLPYEPEYILLGMLRVPTMHDQLTYVSLKVKLLS
jgi:hypothetical protein